MTSPLLGKRLLILFNGQAAYDHFIGVAIDLRNEYGMHVQFWPVDPQDHSFLEIISKHGFEVVGPLAEEASDEKPSHAPPLEPTTSPEKKTRSIDRWREWLPTMMARSLRRIFLFTRILRSGRAAMSERLRRLRPDVILTAQERPPAYITILANARSLGIPTVMIPPNFLCNPDGGAYMRRNDFSLFADKNLAMMKSYGGLVTWLLNRIIATVFPSQIFLSRFGKMLCYPAEDILSYWLAGLLPHNIWFQGSRFIDRIIVSGEEEIQVCTNAGIDAYKIAMLGCPLFDKLIENAKSKDILKKRLCRQFSILPQDQIVIFAIPVGWEHKMISKDQQFDFLKEIFTVLNAPNRRILVSLHPKSSRSDYEMITRHFHADIIDEPLFDVLPAANLFVAGAYSSTIRWALALGIPTANMDVWGLNDSTYWNIDSFPTFTDISSFAHWYQETSNGKIPTQAFPQPFKLENTPGFNHRLATMLKGLIGLRSVPSN